MIPLVKCKNLEKLDIRISGILDENASPIVKMKSLKEANFRSTLFETEQFAMLVAKLKNVKLSPNMPYYTTDLDVKNNTFVVGKKKPWLNNTSDKLKEYEIGWNKYLKKYNA